MSDGEMSLNLEEATSAVSQQALELEVLPYELNVISPELNTQTISLSNHRTNAPLQLTERWSIDFSGDTGILKNESGQQIRLQVGQQGSLDGHALWLVDTQFPWLGSLESCSGEQQGAVWNLGYRAYRIGRKNNTRHNEIELNHPTISRAHASIYPDPQAHVLLKAESTSSPVQVNSKPILPSTEIKLQNGDLIQLGELLFRFRQTSKIPQPAYFPTDGSLPSQIGSCEVVGTLGTGAMGIVYEGRDRAGRAVAIKIPFPHLIKDDEFIRRFNREMKLGTELDHPRVTRIYQYQEAGGEAYPYLVMEKIEGESLQSVPLPIPLQQALRWAEQLLEALQYLHEQGVIHRDLKPANLYLTESGIQVADFGIAHFAGTLGARATQTGTILGTPVYLDPAMLRGQSADLRSDLYATGVLLYEWCVGVLPYPADPLQIFRIKLSEDLPPMSDTNPQLPAPLCQFVDKLIHPDPDARFQSADEARLELAILKRSLWGSQ
ncbi:protein kinase [bacterium]|nr:protein kinase [bacterium]